MKKICFVTGTRADYGIMAQVMREIQNSPEAELQIVATNMHLSPLYGMTVKEIEADGFKVDAKIESLVQGGTPASTLLSMAKVQEGLAEEFQKLKPDLVVILGDRYEALAAASASSSNSAGTLSVPVLLASCMSGSLSMDESSESRFSEDPFSVTGTASTRFSSVWFKLSSGAYRMSRGMATLSGRLIKSSWPEIL